MFKKKTYATAYFQAYLEKIKSDMDLLYDVDIFMQKAFINVD